MPKATFKLWPDRKCRYCGHLIKGGRYAGVSLANHIRFNHNHAAKAGAADKQDRFLRLMGEVVVAARQLKAARTRLRELHRQLSAIKF